LSGHTHTHTQTDTIHQLLWSCW